MSALPRKTNIALGAKSGNPWHHWSKAIDPDQIIWGASRPL